MTLGFSTARETFVNLRSFSFTRIWWYPLRGYILYHDSVSVIVPRFTSFVEDFVLCCCQVTTIFCSWNRSLIASSARNPRNLGFQGYVAISDFGEVSINTVLPFLCHHFWSITFRIWVRSFRGMCEHMSPGSLDLLWRAFTSQECLALDLACSSRLLVHGSPWPACHDLSASLSRMHSCHFVLLLDLIMSTFSERITLIRWSRCWRQNAAGIWWQSWYNEK